MALNTHTESSNTDWKAQGFVNIYVPKVGGEGKTKIGALRLRESNKYEAQMLKRLQAGGEEAVAALLKCITLDFRLTDDPKAPAPVLPF